MDFAITAVNPTLDRRLGFLEILNSSIIRAIVAHVAVDRVASRHSRAIHPSVNQTRFERDDERNVGMAFHNLIQLELVPTLHITQTLSWEGIEGFYELSA